MGPARLGEAPAQHLVAAIEEDHLDVEVVADVQFGEALLEGLGIESAGAGVEADGDRALGPGPAVIVR